jgi:hypothetical protein
MYYKYRIGNNVDYLCIGPLIKAQAKEWIMNSYNTIVSIDGMPFNDNSSWAIGGNKWILVANSETLTNLLIESNLDKAKRLYPIGTKFYPVHVDQREKYCIVTNSNFKECNDGIASLANNGEIWNTDKIYGNTNLNRMVFYDGKWAEIIKEEEEEKVNMQQILEEVRRLYPVGTKCITLNNEGTPMSFEEIIPSGETLRFYNSKKISYTNIDGYLWVKGKFAQIILEDKQELPSKLSEDELLKEAAKRFPLGCTYKSHSGNVYKNAGKPFYTNFSTCKNIALRKGEGCVYYDGQWKGKLIESESIEHSKLQSDTYLYKVFDFAYTEEPVVIKNINSIEKILIKKKKKSNF